MFIKVFRRGYVGRP